MTEVAPILLPDWRLPSGVKAFYTTRLGGHSVGTYHSFNLALHVGDAGQLVRHNRALLPQAERIQWLEQVHGTDCVEVVSPTATPIRADAAFTRHPGTVCGVLTADCLPILLCDQQASVVAAIHAGWRGLADGIIEQGVAKLGVPAHQCLAWIGPAISQAHFEVGDDVRSLFTGYTEAIVESHTANKYRLDLGRIAAHKLANLGVDVTNSKLCTYQDEKRFFSHRRATHQGQNATGRIFTGIFLPAPTL